MTKSLFWEKCPALLAGISLLIAVSTPLFGESEAKWILPALWGIYLIWISAGPGVVLMGIGILYGVACKQEVAPQETTGLFSIHSLKPHVSPFGTGLKYQGTLYVDGRGVDCTVMYRGEIEEHPRADCDYVVEGALIARGRAEYVLKVKDWHEVPNSFSLAELRYRAKEKFKSVLGRNLSERSAHLLGSLTTGDVEDRLLRYEFGRLGLQHLLAISGFHFAIVLSICSLFCGKMFSRKWTLVLLSIVLNSYFLFIGASAAVQRSWLIAQLYILAEWLGKKGHPLNLLGLGIIVELLIEPRAAGLLGFQLSFLSAAGILLFFRPIEQCMLWIWPKQTREELVEMTRGTKLICAGAHLLRRALSLNFAVNLAIFPLLLFHFHQFPVLSLFYNLFIPPLVALSLFTLCISLFFPICFPICDFLTSQILDFISHPPLRINYGLRIGAFPAEIALLALFLLLFVAITIDERTKNEVQF
jgi:competence protein ComEC